MGNLVTPEKIRNLQKKLYVKAKSTPGFRFYSLYDKICRADIIDHAYLLAKANGGSAGVDGVTFDQIETAGRARFLEQLREELVAKTYRPNPVLRVNIPKPDGGVRPLGIPTVRDRVAQTAAKLVLEPIFEADFTDNSYAYRPERSALDAVREVLSHGRKGHRVVVDADLSKYFDTIPHGSLMRSVARRVNDKAVLRLIKSWLKAPIEERLPGGKRSTTGGQSNPCGTPQGGVISPLLANIYMRRFLVCWEQQGLRQRLRAQVVNYADDFVILCPSTKNAELSLQIAERILSAIGLSLNRDKTKLVDANEGSFDFLGYSFGPLYRSDNGKRYFGARPSKKAQSRFKAKARAWLDRGNMLPRSEVIGSLNRMLQGWAGYFCVDTVGRVFRNMDYHIRDRVCWWLSRRHKINSRRARRFHDEALYGEIGLLRLGDLVRARRSNALA